MKLISHHTLDKTQNGPRPRPREQSEAKAFPPSVAIFSLIIAFFCFSENKCLLLIFYKVQKLSTQVTTSHHFLVEMPEKI